MSTISTTVTTTVTLGSAAYPSPLTITDTGSVIPTAAGATAVYESGGSYSLYNNGYIRGGYSKYTSGGSGVDLSAGTLMNSFVIDGGEGRGGGGTGVAMSGGTLTNSSDIGGGDSYAGSSGAGVVLDGGTLTSTSTGTITAGYAGFAGAASSGVNLKGGTLMNYGHIRGGSAFGYGGSGVYWQSGTLINSGVITGGTGYRGAGGAGVSLGNGTLNNNGNIAGGAASFELGGAGLTLSGGTLTNNGSISGGYSGYRGGGTGVVVHGGTLTNSGKIVGGSSNNSNYTSDGYGVLLDGGTLTNTGSIVGGYCGGRYSGSMNFGEPNGAGVVLDAGTLTTSGTISAGQGTGASDHAVQFAGTACTLVVHPGAVFNGLIGGFAIGDTIDITNLTPAEALADFNATDDKLTTTDDGSLKFVGNFEAEHFVLSTDGTTGTDITLQEGSGLGSEGGGPCYCRGTLIRTPTGDTPVQNLSIGDLVLTASGETRPVRWLGSRGVDCMRYRDPTVVWPVRIQAGAFAWNLPARDLWVSPGHSILVESVLIQAERLVNGATVVQVPRERVEYWHVELDSHDILLAEGLPAESYLDTGNRTAFVNGGAYLEAYPDFAPKHWSDTCVPLVLEGPTVRSAKAALLARAKALGYGLTSNADVHMMADGRRVEPVRLSEKRLAFMLPAPRSSIELRCRSFIPAHIEAASDDQRALGICVSRLQINGNEVALDDETVFALGWQRLEGKLGEHQWRWSDDRAPLAAGARLVVIDLAHQGHYWAKPSKTLIALFG